MHRLNKIQLTKEETKRVEEAEEKALTPYEAEEEAGEAESPFRFLEDWKEKLKLKPFPWKGLNAKNALIAGSLVLIAVAGYLNIRFGLTVPQGEEIAPNDTEISSPANEESMQSYFANAVIDRERVRDEALEVLVSITEDASASTEAKANAYAKMEHIASLTTSEIDIENLVKAKGFAECVAVVDEESANIVVQTQGLTAGEVAQIKEIVYLEANILPKDIKIIEKN